MTWSRLLIWVPFALFVLVAVLQMSTPKQSSASMATASTGSSPSGRFFIIIVDSLRKQNLDDPREMPHLGAFSRSENARRFDLTTCSANFSLQCLQTLLEGRESPFGADITRFTGSTASAGSLPSLAHNAGLRVALLSYRELIQVYESVATLAIDSGVWDPDPLTRDLRMIDETIGLLDETNPHVVIVHIDGTDKAAHYKKPGTELYREHFRKVDAKLQELVSHIDFEKDYVLFTGDHGHNENGDHTHDSVAIFAGSPFLEFIDALSMPDDLMARDLLFFYAYALGFALPPDYEGRYVTPSKGIELPRRTEHFLSLQAEVLKERGYAGATLEERANSLQIELEQRHLQALYATLPLVLCYLGVLFWFGARRELSWRLGAILGFGAFGILFTLLSHKGSCGWFAVPAALATLVPLVWRRARSHTLFLITLTLLSACLSYYARDWALWLHTTGGLRWIMLVFFGSILTSGAWLAWIRNKSLSRLPWGALAFGMFCLPSGVYYYQMGQNVVQSFALGLGALLLFTLLTRPKWMWNQARKLWRPSLAIPLIGLALCIPLIFLQEAGAWQWNHLMTPLLDRWGHWPILLIYYPIGLLLLSRLPDSWKQRTPFAIAWVSSHLYAVEIGQVPVPNFVLAQVPLLLFFFWDELQQHAQANPSQPGEPAPLDALLLSGAILTSVWFVMNGFAINSIDYAFTDRYVGWVHQEKNRFMLTGLATVVKYGCPTVAALIYLHAKNDRLRTASLVEGAIFFLQLKLALLLLQILLSALGTTEKLYQLPMTDAIMVLASVVTIGVTFIVFVLSARLGSRVSSRPGKPSMSTANPSEQTS